MPKFQRSPVVSLFAFWILATSVTLAQESYTIAVIGTGNMGSALGPKLAGVGHTVIYGSRDPSRDKVKELVAATGADVFATTQRDAAQQSQIIILAVPWSAVESLIPKLGDLSGKIIIDITTGDRQGSDGYPELAVETSTSELIQEWAPAARIVKTPFSAASTVRNPLRHGEPTVTYIAADDLEAKEVVATLAIQLQFFPLDAGPLRMARTIDHLGLLYLTPMIQGRNHTWDMLPRIDMDLSCISTDGWFDKVRDEGNLARFPNLEAAKLQCPESKSPTP
jgi:predicted dinucleotide-binding enzyme